ncbi:MAG: hypothetical protein P0Y60_11875 [Candidatus Microbacterium colombiense]|nr:MAG: hypothetical protein P0Y60_11875 [Microbacterium sp.]
MRGDEVVLERALVEADPARTPRDAAPDARALAIRDRILLRHRHRNPVRGHSRAVSWTSGLVVATAAVVFAVAMVLPQGAAVASTPTPLAFHGTGTVSEIVQDADTALAAAAGPSVPERSVVTATWSYSADDDGAHALIVPQLSTTTWNEDLSGHVRIVNGVPYDPADAVANNRGEIVSSGDVVDEFDMEPGEFNTPVPLVPGESATDVRAMLQAFGMPDEPTAFDVVKAITFVFGHWTLTNAQHAELLALIETAGGADALGETRDRLGRPVAGLRVLSADGYVSDVVLISMETGRIVGVERTALKDDGISPVGAITGYRVWDIDEEQTR